MFTIPDKGEGANDIQSILFQEYLDVLAAGIAGTDCVLSGLAVTAQGSPNMTVAVASGVAISNGVSFAVTGANGTITTADGTNPRIDLVVITSAGAIAVRAGTPAAAPKPPARTANDVVLAAVYVPASDTTIASNQITDLRVMRADMSRSAVVTADFTKINNTFANVTDLTFNVLAGHWYRVQGRFNTETSGFSSALGRIDMNGGSATVVGVSGVFSVGGQDYSHVGLATEILLGDGVLDLVLLDTTVEINAAGTLIFRFAQATTDPDGVATLYKYSTVTLTDVTPA